MRLPSVGDGSLPWSPPATGSLVPRARVSGGGLWGGGGAAGCGRGLWVGPSSSPPLFRHPEVLPGHPHDAGLQAGPLLQGLLAIPVSSHAPGNWGAGTAAGWGPGAESRAPLGIQCGGASLAQSGPLSEPRGGLGPRISSAPLPLDAPVFVSGLGLVLHLVGKMSGALSGLRH